MTEHTDADGESDEQTDEITVPEGTEVGVCETHGFVTGDKIKRPDELPHPTCGVCDEPLKQVNEMNEPMDIPASDLRGRPPVTDGGTDTDSDRDPDALIDAGKPGEAVEAAREQGRTEAAREFMNLARSLYDEHVNLTRKVEDIQRGDGSHLSSAVYQSRGDALLDAAQHIRQTSRYLDGQTDRPAILAHGQELADDGQRIPGPDRGGN